MVCVRKEKDSLGWVKVPSHRYYGAQTQRALENFPIGGRCFPRSFIWSLGLVKMHAAEVNVELGILDPKLGSAIALASEEVRDLGMLLVLVFGEQARQGFLFN